MLIDYMQQVSSQRRETGSSDRRLQSFVSDASDALDSLVAAGLVVLSQERIATPGANPDGAEGFPRLVMKFAGHPMVVITPRAPLAVPVLALDVIANTSVLFSFEWGHPYQWLIKGVPSYKGASATFTAERFRAALLEVLPGTRR